MIDMPGEEEFREKLLTYRYLEARLESIAAQKNILMNKISEITATLNSIEELVKNDNILFPIGSEAFVPGKILEKNKVIVEIGANVALEKDIDNAKIILEKRKKEIERTNSELEVEIVQISNSLRKLAPEIQELASSSQDMSQAG